MKKWIALVIAWHVSIVSGLCVEQEHMDIARDILLICRSPEDPLPNDDLSAYAKGHGLSDADVSEILIELAKDGLCENADALQSQLTGAALWALPSFGGERESEFVRKIMMTTNDNGLRRETVLVWMRIVPEKWEDMVREVAADSRFDSLTRYVTYQEAYRIGQNRNEPTRKRVEQVLMELSAREESPGNRRDMQKWVDELKER